MKNAPRHPQPGHSRPNVTRQTVRHRDGLQGRDEEQGFLRSEQGTAA